MTYTCALYAKAVKSPKKAQTFCRFGKCIDFETKKRIKIGFIVKTEHCCYLKEKA